jgi:hypothetical protein
MNKNMTMARPARAALLFAAFFLSASCAPKKDEPWKSPADEASLAKLEELTLKRGLSADRRARLFFLWGQELSSAAGTDSSGNAADGTGNRERAIGAFERVVDLGGPLVDESRYNLEILWREQDQQNQQNQQDQKDAKQDDRKSGGQQQKSGDQKSGDQSQSGQQKSGQQKSDQQKSGDQSQSGQQSPDQQKSGGQSQSGQQKSGQQSPDQQKGSESSSPKDLSSLVRSKAQGSDLEAALKAESERRNQKQQAEAGKYIPVEKDW